MRAGNASARSRKKRQLDFDEILSSWEIQYIQKKCQPDLERNTLEVNDHTLHLKWTMEPNEFMLMAIRLVLE